jgi:1,4-dihydroxy-2-naphthoyl-CoA hydrolase
MHDTDSAGRLYFARQFRFVNDALEDFVEHEGTNYRRMFVEGNFIIPIVHAEADYHQLLRVGDYVNVHVSCERIGTTSFTFFYRIFKKEDKSLAGTARTVHVCLSTAGVKVPVPEMLKEVLTKYLLT